MPQDIEITCQDCSTPFPFTVQEQEFFAEKGFTDPKRCRACRQVRKERGGNNSGSGERQGSRQGGGRPPQRSEGRRDDRPMFDVTCSGCGVDTQVPFQPSGDRPVYCRDCFRVKGAARG